MTIEDFTKYYDSEFIEHAYKAILKRDPDSSGSSSYLHALRSGKKTKIEILCTLRFSKEGIDKNVSISNLKKHYLLYKAFNFPFIGTVLRFFFILFRLPLLLQEINKLKAHNDILVFKLREIDTNFQQTDSNFDVTTTAIEELSTLIDTKASENDIRVLYQILSTKLDQKESKIK